MLNRSDARGFCRPVVRDLNKVPIIRESCHGSVALTSFNRGARVIPVFGGVVPIHRERGGRQNRLTANLC